MSIIIHTSDGKAIDTFLTYEGFLTLWARIMYGADNPARRSDWISVPIVVDGDFSKEVTAIIRTTEILWFEVEDKNDNEVIDDVWKRLNEMRDEE